MVGRCAASDADDVNDAVEEASRAFAGWAATPAPVRGRVLLTASRVLEAQLGEVADFLFREEGKTIGEAKGEVTRAVRILEYFGGEGRGSTRQVIPSERERLFMYTVRQPLGVVALIAPWNFPIAIPAWKIAPALVCGNTVVFKPASQAPLTSQRLARILQEAGLPKGVLNYVTGSGGSAGGPLVAHPKIRAISFTGGDATGRGSRRSRPRVSRASSSRWGAKPHDRAARRRPRQRGRVRAERGLLLDGSALHRHQPGDRGESCGGGVPGEAGGTDEGAQVGDPVIPSVHLGPAIDAAQLETTLKYLEIGKSEGGRVVYGGERLTEGPLAHGHYVRPSIVTGVSPSSRLAQEEVSAPCSPFSRSTTSTGGARGQRGALRAVRPPLHQEPLARPRVRAAGGGGRHHDQPASAGIEYQIPFGGLKDSSFGPREQGPAALQFYTETKTVYAKY